MSGRSRQRRDANGKLTLTCGAVAATRPDACYYPLPRRAALAWAQMSATILCWRLLMTTDASPLDATHFFTTDPLHGALLDRNGDDVPDDLRVRLVVLGVPTTEEWIELIHLAARLGLETGG